MKSKNKKELVLKCLSDWINAGMGDECFWEEWPECPTEILLTPNMVLELLEDMRFQTWSGSGKPEHHHYGDGGLLRHTYEVVRFCDHMSNTHNEMSYDKIFWKELLVSAVWHDYGKIWDYQKIEGMWGKYDNHARQIHHISRSAMEFQKHYTWLKQQPSFKEDEMINPDNIIHNILSHHGQREWGSPVAPATKEAWILHLADNLSARLDDCGKHDIINH